MSTKKIDLVDLIKRLKKLYSVKTDYEVADIIGLNRSTLAGWKKRNYVNVDLMLDICKAKNISEDWLLFGKPFSDGTLTEKFTRSQAPDSHQKLILRFRDKRWAEEVNAMLLKAEGRGEAVKQRIKGYLEGVLAGGEAPVETTMPDPLASIIGALDANGTDGKP
jgi:hypothetical protein